MTNPSKPAWGSSAHHKRIQRERERAGAQPSPIPAPLVERVQIPVGRTITAFGPGGVVYLTSRDGMVTTLEKASVR